MKKVLLAVVTVVILAGGAWYSRATQASSQVELLLILGVLIAYAAMASQYESLRDPFIVMFSVSVAAIGVVGSLKLTATPFSLQAYIGVTMLAGIVVSNAILPPSVSTLFEEGWTGLRPRAVAP
jgi:hydrophobic/amphiphilic exporter-1 (mainly G- bacteria), HAE1 family